MMRSITGKLGTTWVDHDGGFTLHRVLLQLGAGYRVRICWVRTNNHDAIGIL